MPHEFPRPFEIVAADAACAGASQRLLEGACRQQIDLDKPQAARLVPGGERVSRGMGDVLNFFGGGRSDVIVGGQGTTIDARRQQQFFTHIDQVLPTVPRGKTIDAKQFSAVFGANAQMLKDAGIVSVTRDYNDHFVIVFQSAQDYQSGDSVIKRDATMEFDYSVSNGSAQLDHIQGLHVQAGAEITVDTLRFTHEQNGNTKLEAQGHWGWFHGSKTVVFDKDGEPLP